VQNGDHDDAARIRIDAVDDYVAAFVQRAAGHTVRTPPKPSRLPVMDWVPSVGGEHDLNAAAVEGGDDVGRLSRAVQRFEMRG
jgi:hypothetical protein